MSGKIKLIIVMIVTTALVSGVWAFVMFNKTKAVTAKYESEISQLTATLDALGPNVDCYTVTDEYVAHVNNDTTGQVIENNALQVISVPESLVGDSYVMSPSEVVGKYFKINVLPGTPITKDLVMAEKYDDTLRDVDIVVDRWIVGMRVGDYVDINFTLPFGQDYIVLSHKRIQDIGSKTIKLYLTEEEWHVYNSALVDNYLNKINGSMLYLKKYVEPGVQKVATPYYAPSDAVRTAMLLDPNVVDRAEINAKATFRPGIDGALNQFITEQTTLKTQASAINSGRNTDTGNVNSDYNSRVGQQNNTSTEDTYVEEDTKIVLDPEAEESIAETVAPETIPVETGEVETTPVEETTPEVQESLPPETVG